MRFVKCGESYVTLAISGCVGTLARISKMVGRDLDGREQSKVYITGFGGQIDNSCDFSEVGNSRQRVRRRDPLHLGEIARVNILNLYET